MDLTDQNSYERQPSFGSPQQSSDEAVQQNAAAQYFNELREEESEEFKPKVKGHSPQLFSIAEQTSGLEDTEYRHSNTCQDLNQNYQCYDEIQRQNTDIISPDNNYFSNELQSNIPYRSCSNSILQGGVKTPQSIQSKSIPQLVYSDENMDRLEAYFLSQRNNNLTPHNARLIKNFEAISDEDLLASSKDALSSCKHQAIIESSRRETPYIKQLLFEIKSLRHKLNGNNLQSANRESTLINSKGVMATPELVDHEVQTYGPRKTSYYRSVPSKYKQSYQRHKSMDQGLFDVPSRAYNTLTLSPQKQQQSEQNTQINREEVVNLRCQIKDHLSENILLSDKIKALEKFLALKDALIQRLQFEHSQVLYENRQLIEQANLHQNQVEGLKAEYAEFIHPISMAADCKAIGVQTNNKAVSQCYVQTDYPQELRTIEQKGIENLSQVSSILGNESEDLLKMQELENKALRYELEYTKLEAEIKSYKQKIQHAVKVQKTEEYWQHHTTYIHRPDQINKLKELELKLQAVIVRDMENQNKLIEYQNLLKSNRKEYKEMKEMLKIQIKDKSSQIKELKQTIQKFQFKTEIPLPQTLLVQDIFGFVSGLVDSKLNSQTLRPSQTCLNQEQTSPGQYQPQPQKHLKAKPVHDQPYADANPIKIMSSYQMPDKVYFETPSGSRAELARCPSNLSNQSYRSASSKQYKIGNAEANVDKIIQLRKKYDVN